MEECGAPSLPSALYKGAGLELDRPARPIKTQKAKGGWDRPVTPTSNGSVSRLHRSPPRTHGRHVANVQDRRDG